MIKKISTLLILCLALGLTTFAQSPWKFTLTGSAGTLFIPGLEGHWFARPQSLDGQAINAPDLTVESGLLASYEIAPRLEIFSGLNYRMAQYNHYNICPYCYTFLPVERFYRNHTLEMPLGLKYDYLKKDKLSLYVQGSVSPGAVISTNSWYTYSGLSEDILVPDPGENWASIGFRVGTGAEFNIAEKMSLGVNPYVGYHQQSILKGLDLGGNLQLSYSL